MTIPLVIGVNPLQTTWLERGIVSGRVALLLRSAEIHPLFERFVRWTIVHPPSSWSVCTLRGPVKLWGTTAQDSSTQPAHPATHQVCVTQQHLTTLTLSTVSALFGILHYGDLSQTNFVGMDFA